MRAVMKKYFPKHDVISLPVSAHGSVTVQKKPTLYAPLSISRGLTPRKSCTYDDGREQKNTPPQTPIVDTLGGVTRLRTVVQGRRAQFLLRAPFPPLLFPFGFFVPTPPPPPPFLVSLSVCAGKEFTLSETPPSAFVSSGGRGGGRFAAAKQI